MCLRLKGIILEMQGKHVARTGMYRLRHVQSLTDSTEFFIAETWKNDGELQKHGETAHLKQHLNEIKDMGALSYKGSFQKIYVCPSVND